MKRFGFVLAVLSLVVAACGSAPPTPQILTLTASDIQFDQTQFEVTANQPVKLTYNNTGQLEHDFSIMRIAVTDVSSEGDHMHSMAGMSETPDVHLAVGPGDTGILYFTPTVSGAYEFFCTVSGHKEAGMTGALVVK